VIPFWKWKELSWYGCKEKTERRAVQPREAKAQQSSTWPGEPESAAREGGSRNLDSGATEMFMDRQTAARHGFKLQKLERLIAVRNVDGTNNSREAITYQVECNVFYKGHMERMRIDVCDLGKTEVILGMPWLAAHNLEINWETREVKIMRCLPLCSEKSQRKEKVKRVATEEEEKIVC